MVKKKLVELAEWKALKDHVNEIRKYHLKDLFVQDKNRLNHFSLEDDDIYLDYSKNLITTRTMDLLIKLAYSRNLNSEIEKMFAGQKINQTEDRAVLHIAQRNLSRSPIFVNGHNIMPSVFEGLEKMKQTTRLIRGRKWRGYSHKPVKHIVNIGVGGSDLGPRVAFQALEFYSKRDLTFH
ncbi:MAG: glucose-6-phosphate isomerase, partial [Candidatus Aminicenantes bacterium]|nr:glucose-6-phosphate isomerase [Candidatus Aminicenantes bacterium]